MQTEDIKPLPTNTKPEAIGRLTILLESKKRRPIEISEKIIAIMKPILGDGWLSRL
jgi:hypothetical protein